MAHIKSEEMKPGDIVFIISRRQRVTHGGVFIDWKEYPTEFWFLNASSEEETGCVRVDFWPVDGIRRGQWFAGAGRLLTSRM